MVQPIVFFGKRHLCSNDTIPHKQSSRHCLKPQAQIFNQKPLNPRRVVVKCGLSANCVIDSYFFEDFAGDESQLSSKCIINY